MKSEKAGRKIWSEKKIEKKLKGCEDAENKEKIKLRPAKKKIKA